MEQVYISLGSNSGDSEAIIVSALNMLNAEFGIASVSKLYRTSPQIIYDQADFLNCAAVFSVSSDKQSLPALPTLSTLPMSVLEKLQTIEALHGRDRSSELRNGPRTLDIDIIFFGKQIIREAGLQVPHKAYKLRRFVLLPLLDINPNLQDPETGTPLKKFSAELEGDPKQGIYCMESNQYNSLITELRKQT